MDFCYSWEIYLTNIGKHYQICYKSRTRLKSVSKKVAHKTAAATGKLIGNKIANKIVKKPVPDVNWRNIKKRVILPEKRPKILSELRQVL